MLSCLQYVCDERFSVACSQDGSPSARRGVGCASGKLTCCAESEPEGEDLGQGTGEGDFGKVGDAPMSKARWNDCDMIASKCG